MMNLDPDQLEALAAAISEGTFDAAARALHVTPSAVSQRVKALETSVGQVLLIRSKPVRATTPGETLLRAARQIRALSAEARDARRDQDHVRDGAYRDDRRDVGTGDALPDHVGVLGADGDDEGQSEQQARKHGRDRGWDEHESTVGTMGPTIQLNILQLH